MRKERDLDRSAFNLANRKKETLLKKLIQTKVALLEAKVPVKEPPKPADIPPTYITISELKMGKLAKVDDAEVKAALDPNSKEAKKQ